MTIENVITKVDDLSPNQYTVEQKIGWLSNLDHQIYIEVFQNHMTRPCEMVMFFPEEGYTTDDVELIVPAPYAEDIYVYYLLARIADMNAEITKYNQYISHYNSAFSRFSAWYNRTHMPKTHARWRF